MSHNKVLIGSGDGGSKKPHARNPNFDSEETKLLIQIWGDPQVISNVFFNNYLLNLILSSVGSENTHNDPQETSSDCKNS